jgi:PAS domain S-box-containing protein
VAENDRFKTEVIRKDNRRLTIGFVAAHLTNKNNYTVWQGIIDTARSYDINVMSVFPEDLNTTNEFDAQANVLYDLINPDLLDGVIIYTAMLIDYAGPEGAKRIFDRFGSIPVVCIERGGPEHLPFVEIDSYNSMRESVIHLIRDHGYGRIAFVRGPDSTHVGARDRYQGYLDVLTEYGIPFDPDLVSPPTNGSWKMEAGEQAVALFLDERHVEFDALVGACDFIAIGAIRALEARGISIPGKVAVSGFDDDTGSLSSIPPLTTMSLRGYEQGRQAVMMLIDMIYGGGITSKTVVSPQLIVRQSCGCTVPEVIRSVTGQMNESSGYDFLSDKALREKIVSGMKNEVGQNCENDGSGWAELLLESFFEGIQERRNDFITLLEGILRKAMTSDFNAESWVNAISVFRRCLLPYLSDKRMMYKAEDLWLQSQILIGDTSRQALRHKISQIQEQSLILNKIRAELINTFNIDDLMDIIARELPRLGISGCYLSLYDDPVHPLDQSSMVLAYDDLRGRIALDFDKIKFFSSDLAPEGILPENRIFDLVIQALYFRDEQLGFIMFESGPREGQIYDILREEISSALQGALLVRRVNERSAELRRQQYILDMFMDNIPDRIYFKNTESRLTRVNRSFADMFGVKEPDMIIGMSDYDFFPPEQAEKKYHQEQMIINTGRSITGLEEPDGIDKWSLTTKMPLRDEKGDIIGTFGISTDITELVKAKQAIENRANELEKAYETLQKQQKMLLVTEKMASLGRITAGISHELNTLIATIRTSLADAENLINEYKASINNENVTDEDYFEIARELYAAVNLAKKFSETASGFLRGIKSQTYNLSSGKYQQIDVISAVEDALLLLRHSLMQNKCVLVFDKPESPVYISGIPGRIEHIVTNLVENAVEASYPQGGTITVLLMKNSEFVELAVSDHGKGIPPENMSKIFDPLFTTKPFGDSAGLGLTVIHDIVTGEFGGSIGVNSIPELGTTVTVRLNLNG